MTSSEVTRPRPTAPPVYRDGPSKMSEVGARSWGIDDVLDSVFFAIAAVATLWLAWLLIGSGWHLEPALVVNSLLFWAVLAYLALPRLHQVLTWLYVPDYFIGRTRTPDGLLGDPVNLAVKGDEEDIHEAMVSAGWVRADPITLRSSWRIVVSSLLRRSYPAAPVSNLLLFGRRQSFAYQKEVEGNPAQRHHVRFWHCPPGWVLPGGGRVDWLAAATYDRAVGLSVLTLQVTHKIDADIDIERDFVVDDVRWANDAAELQIWPDFFTSYHDKNGGGDRVVTDGALHVLDLNEVVPGSDSGLSLELAHLADLEARRRRPSQLVIALVLIALLVVAELIRVSRIDVTDLLDAAAITDANQSTVVAFIAIIAVLSSLLTLITAALGVAAWHGHPRGRIALMATFVLGIVTDMGQVSSLGVRQATLGLVVTSALQVLALLALSARQVHEWERARKEERRAARASRSGPRTGTQTAPSTARVDS
ncbi:LssY C-terminal domain-containing protein [Actinomyces sp. Marseille-P3109]|uniref:LssY C-terminal domain-containing protein n=1 Tax=Actinomyces sp. Marseille-P3109 TaxID=2083009 RepID=UPI0019008994|nr:LssY C-terminal domain-containing protein [Actinomyces sp. Marseille-P3109]